ncbi:unnamed protein product [Rodentolepis nana]|uniref:Protein kinase domain-containing protein n=1 Tax=Rodentolepis nana TaxID=102285 RepID=A0A0R3TGQ2_RODNA|nr:unnamed protein product [Rodentolepis nana]
MHLGSCGSSCPNHCLHHPPHKEEIFILPSLHFFNFRRLIDSEWNSPNPEYWHVYEVDDWEMQLEDIDALNFRHPLGKGNFGMVYRGLVKTLRTPAHCFYTDPSNIAAAIKVPKKACLF